MLDQTVTSLLADAIENAEISVEMEGNHCHVHIVAAAFEGLRKLKRQQMVYGALNALIASGEVHAVHMQLFTPDEASAQ